MVTKFTKGVEFFNSLISKYEKGSKEYRDLVSSKHRYIQDFNN